MGRATRVGGTARGARRPKLILKPPGSMVGALAATEEPKSRKHHRETVRCSFSFKREKEVPPHCMKVSDVIQTLYQETGQVQSNHKLEYRLKKIIKLHGASGN